MNEQKPVLGRCKDCDYALWSAPADIHTADTLNDVVPGTAYRMSDKGNLLARCPNRHKVFRLIQVEGEFNPDVKCDGRCEGARGHVCVCACGGMNHGRAHHAIVENVSEGTERFGDAKQQLVLSALSGPEREEQRQRESDEQQVIDAEAEATTRIVNDALFGEVGEQITGRALVTHEQDVSDATLYLFRAFVDGNFGTVKWFKPSYIDVPYAKGDSITFKAKVKRHETEYGNTTLVTYFEGVPDAEG